MSDQFAKPSNNAERRGAIASAVRRVLPASVKGRIRAILGREPVPVVKLPGRAPDIESTADEAAVAAIQFEPAQRKERASDGMKDYPTTRPHLAIDYLSGLVRWLADSDYRVMTYLELDLPRLPDGAIDEFRDWISAAESRSERAVLLHYDVDARPDITTEVLRTHIEHRVPANVMVFHRKIFDWKLKREGVVEFDAYDLDYATLEAFQNIGGVIGYHCNAFDQSGGDEARAIEIFAEDVRELRKHFDIRIVSMHGGHVTPDGKCNATLPVDRLLQELGLTWVHNGRSVYFHANWADGSASNPRYRAESSSPLDFLLSTNPGQRTRLLFHPQYYNDLTNTRFDFPILHDIEWVQRTARAVSKPGYDGLGDWSVRAAEARASIARFDELFVPDRPEAPVFINGLSRSGTTLLVSLFDAHPEGAMAYESYPRYLYVPSDDGVLTVEEYIYTYQTLINHTENEAFRLLNRAPLRNLMRFAAVTGWTGMSTRETGELLRAYLVKHHRVSGAVEALKIVAATARYKVRAENAAFWGTKCQANFDDYFALWPEAKLVYIVRNGLDILASQMTKGAFNPDAGKLGKQWSDHHAKFEHYRAEHPGRAIDRVVYEDLARQPEATMRALCGRIGVPYHPQMVRQHEVESTLARMPRGQLSADRVQQPIDTSSIGRWREILSEADVAAFMEGCGGTALFERFGMDWRR